MQLWMRDGRTDDDKQGKIELLSQWMLDGWVSQWRLSILPERSQATPNRIRRKSNASSKVWTASGSLSGNRHWRCYDQKSWSLDKMQIPDQHWCYYMISPNPNNIIINCNHPLPAEAQDVLDGFRQHCLFHLSLWKMYVMEYTYILIDVQATPSLNN